MDGLTLATAAAAVGSLSSASVAWWRAAVLRRQLATMHHEATHDGLTGLANRAGLVEAWDRLAGGQWAPAVLLLDLDKFKPGPVYAPRFRLVEAA